MMLNNNNNNNNNNNIGTGVGQVGASAYHGKVDAPAYQSLGWALGKCPQPLATLVGVTTQGRGDPSVLVDSPFRESVSIKTLVLVAP